MPKRKLGARAKRLCKKPLVDAADLNRLGAHNLYLDDGTVRIKTARKKRATRIWETGYRPKKAPD